MHNKYLLIEYMKHLYYTYDRISIILSAMYPVRQQKVLYIFCCLTGYTMIPKSIYIAENGFLKRCNLSYDTGGSKEQICHLMVSNHCYL